MAEDFCKKGPDSTTGCQSDCDQPGSGASGGDVQSRVIGYYEAWAHDRTCSGMDFDQIPVSGLVSMAWCNVNVLLQSHSETFLWDVAL
jgi:chitinase